MHDSVYIFIEEDSNDSVTRQKLGLENSPLKMAEVQSSSGCKRTFVLVSLFVPLALQLLGIKWKVSFAGSVR